MDQIADTVYRLRADADLVVPATVTGLFSDEANPANAGASFVTLAEVPGVYFRVHQVDADLGWLYDILEEHGDVPVAIAFESKADADAALARRAASAPAPA